MRTLPIFLALLGLITSDAWAKNCRNSQPCGNSCISWNKTCRIGSSSYVSPTPTVRTQPSATSYEAVSASDLYVQGDDTYSVSAPAHTARRLRRLAFGEIVRPYQQIGDWIRISEAGQPDEWVIRQSLTTTRPSHIPSQPTKSPLTHDISQPSDVIAWGHAQTDAAFTYALPSRTSNRIRRLILGEKLAVYEIVGEWARISPAGAEEEWVIRSYLGV
jgi:hypothetical protein